MTPDEARLTQASVVVDLSGKTYHLSPLNDKDIAEIDEWLRGRIVATAVEGLHGQSDRLIATVASEAAVRAQGITWLSGEGARMMANTEGVARIMWQSCRSNHPDVKYEELRKLMFDGGNVAQFNAKFRQVNRVPTGGSSKQARRGRKAQAQR